MFTWICPKCGREVGPHYSECPYCAELANAETKPAAAPLAAPPAPAPVPQAQYPPQPQYPPPAPPVAQVPPPPPPPVQQTYLIGADEGRRKLPGWLAALLAFAAVGAVAFGVIYMTSRDRANGTSKAQQAAAKPGTVGNPYAKYLELTGFRITEAKGKKLQVQFLAVNHGAADLADISGEITLQVKGSPDDEPACRFKFTISSVPGFGAKEILVTEFSQRRKFFEMPDWQFLEPVVDISSSDD